MVKDTLLPPDVEDFINIDEFIFAFNLKKKTISSLSDYDFEYIANCPVREPFHRGIFQTASDWQTEEEKNRIQKGLVESLQEICRMQEKECKHSKLIFGVLGLDQYHFFKSIYPENKIVDVTKYYALEHIAANTDIHRTKKNACLLCENEKQALYHVKRIQMFCHYFSERKLIAGKYASEEDHFDDISNKWLHLTKKQHRYYMLQNISNITDFMYATGLNGDNPNGEINLIVANLKSEYTTTIFDGGKNIKNFLNYYSRHVKYNKDKSFFAVLGQEQLNFFDNMFPRNYNINFFDVSQLIPDEKLDFICGQTNDVTYHARRINLIQEKLKKQMFPPPETTTSTLETEYANMKIIEKVNFYMTILTIIVFAMVYGLFYYFS